jgi:Entner-Doudoroff aldolase
MNAVLDAIASTRIVAIVRLDQYDRAVEIAQALYDGGISAIEFTLTGQGVSEAIQAIRTTFGDKVQVGAGTVLTPDAARQVIDAGAQFLVTPTINAEVISLSRARETPIICGALTPTEALHAYELGADMIKIFPARAFGPAYIRDILAPLPQLKLVPTGGINAKNARDYLDAGAAAVGIGGNLVSKQAVQSNDWAQITSIARACVEAVS